MRFTLLALLISVSFISHSQLRLSDQAEIAVVTIGPYQGEVWSAFGHSGIRITDPKYQIDWFYDYGNFNFEQENFFLNFAFGLLKYSVVVRQWKRTFEIQRYYNRYIKLQYLNLTQKEKQVLFDFMQHNIKPENAEYLYNYVYDNCASKIRDVCDSLYSDKITFDLSYKEEGKTIRNLMDDYLDHQPWGDLGIDLGLGMQIDHEAPASDYMFLPDYIHKAFEGATINRDSVVVPLVKKSIVLYTPKPQEHKNGFLTPMTVFILLFFIVGLITHRNLKSGIRTKWLDAILFAIVGFAGWWVVFLWFGTEHLSKWNLNILWALPFHFPLIFFAGRTRYIGFFKPYFKFLGFWYSLVLLAWPLIGMYQPLHQALVPLILTLALRSFYLNYHLRQKSKEVGPA